MGLMGPRRREPRSVKPNIMGTQFCWRVDNLDWDGRWGWSGARIDDVLLHIVPHLHSLESMKWGDIEGPTGSHFVNVENIVPEARDRLVDIDKGEQEQLFSLRVTGEKRIWGVRDVAILRLLWWDPHHEICPSLKRHT